MTGDDGLGPDLTSDFNPGITPKFGEVPYEVKALHVSGTWVTVITNITKDSAWAIYDLLNARAIAGISAFPIIADETGSRSLKVDRFDMFSMQKVR